MPHDRVVLLGRQPAEVHRARQEVGAFCSGTSGDLRSIAQLLTSELVTNAIRHGSGDIQLQLAWEDDCLRVGVYDGSPTAPRLRSPDPMSSGGRGLILLESLATMWGSQRDAGGKTVWFTLRKQ